MKKKILVIDDELKLAELMKTRLEANGYEAYLASDGVEGLDKVEEINPDLIVLDILMPNLDGYSFVRELKQKGNVKQSPILVYSAKEDFKEIMSIEGVEDYLVKPFDGKVFIEKINKILEDGESIEYS